MSRPYYNFISKDRTMSSIDTRIKRQEINAAIERRLFPRKDAISQNVTGRYDAENSLLRLPPEIRNKIYASALDIGSLPASSIRVCQSSKGPKTNCMPTSALRLCKQINAEASSLMESFDVAYIPVMGSMNYAGLITNIAQHGPSSLSSVQSTMFAALTTFKNIHLHLHVSYRMSSDVSDYEPYLDTRAAYIFGCVRQALLVFTCASAFKFQGIVDNTMKRKAVVHFDHLFSDWRHMLAPAGCYRFKHLLQIMGGDKNTIWEVRYYVHAGGERKAQDWSEWDERLGREFLKLQKECSDFPNIKLVAEVYGELTWSLEGTVAEITRCITPSSTLWPSWPDDVPWRRFSRVRSDEAVSYGDITSHAGSGE